MIKIVLLTGVAALIGLSSVQAAEIKVISANGMREVIAETKAKFEAASGHRLAVTVVETGAIRKRVLAGEAFDVIMVPRDVSDEFLKANRLAPAARSGSSPSISASRCAPTRRAPTPARPTRCERPSSRPSACSSPIPRPAASAACI